MHLVDKHIFDIQYDSEATAIDMQRKISTISNDKLFDLIEEIFDEFDTSETVRIHNLQLDIGKIRESNLEEDLLDAVSIALRQELGARIEIAERAQQAKSENRVQERNNLAIFEQFIVSGTVPWWIRNRNDFDIHKTVNQVLETHLSQVAVIVRRQAKRAYFLERLVLNLTEVQLEQLIRTLAPAEATQVLEATYNIQKVQERRQIVATQQRVYRNKVWEFVLTYLLIDRGTAFNQKMFVQSTLARLAHHFNIEYPDFLKLFYDAVQEMDDERIIPKGLVGIIKEIYAERKILSTSKKTKRSKIDPEITAVYTQLLDTSPNFDRLFEGQLLKLIRSGSEVFKSFVRREAKNRQLHSNLVVALSDASLYLFVGFVEPQSKDIIVQLSQNVHHLKEKSQVSISGSAHEFRKVTWEFIIRALLEDHGSQFNLKSFVKSTLSNIAAHFNIELHDLMHYVLLDLNVHQSVDKSALESVLLEIKHEEEDKIQEDDTKEETVFRLKLKLHWLEYALVHSKFPTWSKRHKLSPESFQTVLFELIREDSSKLQTVLRKQLRDNRKRHFLIRQLDQQGRFQIVRFLNAQAADKIALYDKLLDKIQERRSVAANKQEFETIKWSTILEILTEEKGSFFNYKSFVLRSLYKLSNRLNISFEVLFSYVLEVSSTLPNIPESPLQNALLSIREELKSTVENWSAENVELNKEMDAIWNEVKNDVPPEARILLALLEKMQSDSLFRSQFDLHSWLRKNTSISKDVFRTIVQKLQWSTDTIVKIMGGQHLNSEQQLLQWFVGNDHPFISYYLKDLKKVLAFTNWNSATIIRQSELFSAAYLSKFSGLDKHQYFFSLLRFISQFIGRKPDHVLNVLQDIIKSETPNLNSTLPLSISKAVHGDALTDSTKEVSIPEEELPEEIADEVDEEVLEDEEDLDSIYIQNAGIIIMWPFFRQFFKMLELTEEDSFVSIAASIRGVQLLQYMCTGETSHPEHELILNKLLCGIPISIPIDDSFEISPKEKEIADGMVLGVVANWPGMQDTSVEALRETFFIRAAKISFEDDTIDMHVEKKTVDVLLDRMPWSFTFVNLPWMKKPLRTIWK